MNRDNAKLLLIDYFNGHLNAEEGREIESMIEDDPGFKVEAETIKRELSVFSNSLEDPFEEVRLTSINERVINIIRENKGKSFAFLTPAWRSYLRAATVVIVITFCLALFFYLSPAPMKEAPDNLLALSSETDPVEANPVENIEPENVAANQNNKPEIIKLIFATTNPNVKIYWTLSRDFELQ